MTGRTFMKKFTALLAAAAAVFGLCACGTASEEQEHFQGHWVDINSESTLDISGNKMKVCLFGSGTETYTVKFADYDGTYYLENADGSGAFGMMGELHEYPEECLNGILQVTDASGHEFAFVREEVKEEKLKLDDRSTDMPKTIESDIIDDFTLYFTNWGQYGLGSEWQKCRYNWTITREEDGTWQCEYSEEFDECMGRSYRGEVDEEFIKYLADCIQRSGAVEQNGYDVRNSADGTDYALKVTYDSGEELKIVARGDAGDSCVFDLGTVMEAALHLPDEDFANWYSQ